MISRANTRHAHRTRTAFTLPELLVVVTVTLILMSILVQASTIITNTVSEAKAQGDFVGQERMAIAIMRRDLQFDHFIEEDTKPNLGRKVSDQRIDAATLSGNQIVSYKPPRSGYFWVKSTATDNANNFDEGIDASGFSSSRSGNHFMQFTVVVPGGAPQNTLTADIPMGNRNALTGTCAEVAYFLVPNGSTPGGVAKYKLIRRQRLAARNTDDDPAYTSALNQSGAPPTDPPEVVACRHNGSQFEVFNMNELTFLGARVAPQQLSAHRIGEDVLHNHVTSFELKFTGSVPARDPADQTKAFPFQWPRPFAQNTDFPYDTLPYNGEYDTGDDNLLTGANPSLNLANNTTNTTGRLKPIRITGIQIRLRCWNPSNKQTRQTTTTVDL